MGHIYQIVSLVTYIGYCKPLRDQYDGRHDTYELGCSHDKQIQSS